MRALLAFAFAVFALAGAANAHDPRPLFIKLNIISENELQLAILVPYSIDKINAPRVYLDKPCRETRRALEDPIRQRIFYECAYADAVIKIDWPIANPSISTLVRVSYPSGDVKTVFPDPSQTEIRPPAEDSFGGVAQSYFLLGIEHIIGGIDHLLFLAGLMVIAGTPKRMLLTATGFTISHSLTLGLVALNILRVSVPATEAVIALSIVFLAVEIARADKSTLAWRRPVLVASAFGLVHGAGFAAALRGIGLPGLEKLTALLFFNVGVEAGQVALIILAFSAMYLIRKTPAGPLTAAPITLRAAGYGLGVISAYWFVERVVVMLTPV